MDLAAWAKQNKLAAGAIAAGGAFLLLSRKGSSSTSTDSAGLLTPVAAGYDTSMNTAQNEQIASAAQSAADAAGSAADALATFTPPDPASTVPIATTPAQTTPPSAPFVADPSPSTLTPPAPIIPAPAPAPTITKYPLPSGYSGGSVPFFGDPGNIHMLIGNVLGYKQLGSGSNSNGNYNTWRFFSDIGSTGDWNFYTSGAKKGQWVGPFNLAHNPGG